MGKRERTLKGGWRHGITGIENSDAQAPSVFYSGVKQAKDRIQSQKDALNNNRL